MRILANSRKSRRDTKHHLMIETTTFATCVEESASILLKAQTYSHPAPRATGRRRLAAQYKNKDQLYRTNSLSCKLVTLAETENQLRVCRKTWSSQRCNGINFSNWRLGTTFFYKSYCPFAPNAPSGGGQTTLLRTLVQVCRWLAAMRVATKWAYVRRYNPCQRPAQHHKPGSSKILLPPFSATAMTPFWGCQICHLWSFTHFVTSQIWLF